MFSFRKRARPATKSAPLVALSQLGAASWSARDPSALAREGFEKNAVGYRCVRMIAEAAASVPFTGDLDDSVKTLLARPNQDQSGIELLEAFYGHLQVTGNAYLLALSLDEDIRELHCLRPDRMSPLRDRTGRVVGWAHRVGDQKQEMLREPDGWCPILHLKLFHSSDDVMGFSPLQAAGRAVDVHNAGAAWAKALIDNSARPSGALVYGKQAGERMSEEQYATLKEELESTHMGAANAGRPLLLEGGLDWKPMGLTPADMDFIAARNAAAREIALAMGVPPMMLGIPGDNTYSNYKEANLAFWRLTVLPLVEKTARTLSTWLSARTQTAVELHPDHDRVTALATERDALWMRLEGSSFATVEEKRKLAGLD